jgi:uncharacterized glyoxalase superfamily protein PhnB
MAITPHIVVQGAERAVAFYGNAFGADAEAVFAQAVAAGAEVRQPLQEAFWGDLHGQLEDPFGHRWNISQHLRDVPHDEVVAAAALAFGQKPL